MRDGKKDVKDEHSRPESSESQTKFERLHRNSSQKKDLKTKLQDSEAWYRAIFNNANDAIFLMDHDRFIDCNPKTLEMFGCTKEQIIGQRPYDHFSSRLQPDGQTSKDKALEKIRLALEGQPHSFEWRHLRYDGTPFEAEVTLNRVELFKHFFIQAFVRDITEQKHTHLQYEMILKTAMDGFGVFSKDGNILEVNDAYCNMIGYSQEELLSMNLADIEALESAERITKHIEKLMDSGSHRFETRHKRKDGKLIDLEVSANSFKLDGHRLFAFFRDITEHKREQEMLRKERDKAQSYLNISSVILVADDREANIILINRKGCEVLGYEEKEIIGRKFYDFLPKSIRKQHKEIYKKLMRGEIEPFEYSENPILTGSGEERQIAWHNTILKDESSKIIGILSSGEDITERKKAEQKLLQERDKAQKYLDIAAVIFVALNEEGIVTLINQKGCEILCYEENDIVGKNWFDNFLPKESGKKVKSIFEKLITGELVPVEYYENPVLIKSGEERQIAWHNSLLQDENGRIVGTLSSGEDITDRKKAEKELLRARQDWENIFQAIGQPSFILDPQHKIITANRATVKKAGKPLEQLKGMHCSELLHRKKNPPKECPMEKMLCSGCVETVEMEIEAFGGTYLVSCTPVCDNQGRLEKVIHIAIDITDRQQAENKIREHEEQLKLLASELSFTEERERRRIAAGIHDDIAQRLALAKLELQSMQNSISDPNIISSLKSQCGTIDRIMEDARSLTFELSNPLLYEIGLETAVESFLIEQIRDKSGIKCKFSSQGPQVSLDEDIRIVLYQGARELLTNIVKHANASRIEVRIVKNNTQISIIVEDNGIGLNLSKLGSPERDKGGFGLFNIRERLEFMGGNLNIQSKPNKGTCVTMSIPLKLKVTTQ